MVDESAVGNRAADLRSWYDGYRYKCLHLTELLRSRVERSLRAGDVRDTQVEARAKSVDSFVAKAVKLKDGEFKYADPVTEITDMIGLRVIVPLSTDQEPVLRVLAEEFEVTEEVARGDESGIDVPGYRSIHLVTRVSDDSMDPDLREYRGMTAEIQVRTILQHAWASLQHDLGYKGERSPTPAIRRRLVALAGLIELADREFVDVRAAHLRPAGPARDAPIATDLRGPVTATSLRLFAERLIGEDSAGQEWFKRLSTVVGELGITSLEELHARLGDWASRAEELHVLLQQDRPWVNSAYSLDVLLRLSMGEDYRTRRRAESIPDVEVPIEAEARATEAFGNELASMRRLLGGQ